MRSEVRAQTVAEKTRRQPARDERGEIRVVTVRPEGLPDRLPKARPGRLGGDGEVAGRPRNRRDTATAVPRCVTGADRDDQLFAL